MHVLLRRSFPPCRGLLSFKTPPNVGKRVFNKLIHIYDKYKGKKCMIRLRKSEKGGEESGATKLSF